MDENNNNTANNPGRILKAAREELGYTMLQAADELHLRVSVVEAIENEDYDEFSSDVFLKGYFRSYCRLVKLHEERMVELLDVQLKGRQEERQQLKEERKKLERARKNKKLFINVLAVALGAAILIAVYSYVLSGMEESSTETTQSNAEQMQDNSDSEISVNPLTKASTQLSNEKQVEADSTQADERSDLKQNVIPSIEEQSPEQQMQNGDTSTSIRPADSEYLESQAIETDSSGIEVRENTQEQAQADSQLVSEVNVEPATLGVIEIEFSGDCWFKLVDGSGKTAIAALKRAGQTSTYQGALPFEVVLGDSSKAVVRFNDQTINVAAYTSRNGRAQFKLPQS